MAISNQELANLIQTYWDNLNADRAQWRNFIAGTVAGGPNGDGTYPLTDFTGNTYFLKCPAQVAYEATRISSVTLTGDGPFLLDAGHFNKKVLVQAASAAIVTIQLPRTAPVDASLILRGLNCSLHAVGQSGGATVRNWQGHNGTAGILAPATVAVEANADGNSAVWTLDGATAIVA